MERLRNIDRAKLVAATVVEKKLDAENFIGENIGNIAAKLYSTYRESNSKIGHKVLLEGTRSFLLQSQPFLDGIIYLGSSQKRYKETREFLEEHCNLNRLESMILLRILILVYIVMMLRHGIGHPTIDEFCKHEFGKLLGNLRQLLVDLQHAPVGLAPAPAPDPLKASIVERSQRLFESLRAFLKKQDRESNFFKEEKDSQSDTQSQEHAPILSKDEDEKRLTDLHRDIESRLATLIGPTNQLREEIAPLKECRRQVKRLEDKAERNDDEETSLVTLREELSELRSKLDLPEGQSESNGDMTSQKELLSKEALTSNEPDFKYKEYVLASKEKGLTNLADLMLLCYELVALKETFGRQKSDKRSYLEMVDWVHAARKKAIGETKKELIGKAQGAAKEQAKLRAGSDAGDRKAITKRIQELSEEEAASRAAAAELDRIWKFETWDEIKDDLAKLIVMVEADLVQVCVAAVLKREFGFTSAEES